MNIPQNLKTAPIFTSNMVLQREKPITIWGSAPEGSKILVTLNGTTTIGTTKGGKWTLTLPRMAAGGPYKCIITDSNITIEFTNVMDSHITLYFTNTYNELEVKGKTIKGFEIMDDSGIFVEADAVIEGPNIIVSSIHVKNPKHVRYAWMNYGTANVYNKRGLPLAPFRTDNFKEM